MKKISKFLTMLLVTGMISMNIAIVGASTTQLEVKSTNSKINNVNVTMKANKISGNTEIYAGEKLAGRTYENKYYDFNNALILNTGSSIIKVDVKTLAKTEVYKSEKSITVLGIDGNSSLVLLADTKIVKVDVDSLKSEEILTDVKLSNQSNICMSNGNIVFSELTNNTDEVVVFDISKKEKAKIADGVFVTIKDGYAVYLAKVKDIIVDETELHIYDMATKEDTMVTNFAKFKNCKYDPSIKSIKDKKVEMTVYAETDESPATMSETWSCAPGADPVLIRKTGAAGKGSIWIADIASKTVTIKLGKSKKVSVLIGGIETLGFKKIILPNGLKTIPKNLFNKYSKFTKIYLPKSVTKISKNAFKKIKNGTIYVKKSKVKKMKKLIKKSGINKKVKIKTY